MCEACDAPAGIDRRRFVLGAAAGALALALPSRAPRSLPPLSPPTDLVIHPRDDWGADRPPLAALDADEVRFLLVHHSAGSNTYDDAAAQIQGIYDFHTGPDKGWPDVCYHFFVDRFGGVWEGRAGSLDGPVVADATGGNQGFAELVCLLGDHTDEMPTDAALASLTVVLGWLADRDQIDTAPGARTEFVSRGSNRWPAGEVVTTPTIVGHRAMSATACPGDAFAPYVESDLAAAVTDGRR